MQIIKDGGYATGLTYVEKLYSIIERWNLTKWDVKNSDASDAMVKYYRVRKSWKDAGSQLGAYTVLDNAKAMADKHEGYTAVKKLEGNPGKRKLNTKEPIPAKGMGLRLLVEVVWLQSFLMRTVHSW